MDKFCKRCGAPLDNTGKCPRCSAQPAAAPEPAVQTAAPKRKKSALKAVIISAAAIAAVAAAVTAAVIAVGAKGKDKGRSDSPGEKAEVTIERPDAEEKLGELGTVTSSVQAVLSFTKRSEAEAYADLTGRGFTDFPILAEYSMEGKLEGEREISSGSSEVHPVYTTNYITEAGDVWTITLINGSVFAIPVSFNQSGYYYVMRVLSETDKMIRFDGKTNTFFEYTPFPNEIVMKTVTRIDAQTLEDMGLWEVAE